MTSGTATRRRAEAEAQRDATREGALARRRRLVGGSWAVGLLVLVALVIAGLLSARPTSSTDARPAPPFTLPSTAGGTVSLADFRGSPVVLYFSEGAGCDSCLVQMAEIERFGVQTPFLIDDGSVSTAYGTLGAGMHAGLPGHGFVLIDAEGVQRWYGNYPSMWLAPEHLLDVVLGRI